MQFFTILLVNIFTGAVIYLLLSLKLARSSAEYREQRLKREMDEIIKEFNSTANRNISILENKIAVINRLLRESGSIQGIDITVANEELIDNHVDGVGKTMPQNNNAPLYEDPVMAKSTMGGKEQGIPKKSLPEFFHHGIAILRSKIIEIIDKTDNSRPEMPISASRETQNELVENYHDPYEKLIEKDLSNLDINDITEQGQQSDKREEKELSEKVNESEIADILSSENDRFAAVAELDERGCSVEMIAKYCNMPAGEVRLILNLQK